MYGQSFVDFTNFSTQNTVDIGQTQNKFFYLSFFNKF